MQGSLRGTQFNKLLIGQASSFFGDALISTALAFAVLQITKAPVALGMVLFASRGLLAVFSISAESWQTESIARP